MGPGTVLIPSQYDCRIIIYDCVIAKIGHSKLHVNWNNYMPN